MAQKYTPEQRDEIELSKEREEIAQSLQNIRKTMESGFEIWRGRVRSAWGAVVCDDFFKCLSLADAWRF